ncbi:MAG: alanine racemase, partial [Gammaproteobacteria bacterium]
MGSAWAEINVDALIFNVGVVRKRAPHSKVCAVVKADAYGHGLEEVVRALSPHVDAFAVAHCAEASRVRAVDIAKPVWVFLGFRDQEELLQCV